MPVKRLPLTGAYNTRASSVNALTSGSGIVGVGIVGNMIVGYATPSSNKDVRFINCSVITEADEVANTKRVYVAKRPGIVASLTPAAGSQGAAVHVWAGQGGGTKIISAFGLTNSTIYDSTTSLGSITGRCSGITETSVSGTATLVISSRDSTAWYYQTAGSLTKISDADFPGNAGRTLAGTFAHLDGFAFIMDSTGRVYNSDENSVTAWTTNSYITANSVPDVGIGCVRHRDSIIAFCKGHFDVFVNAGNSPNSPLERQDSLSQLIGCIGYDAITQIRDVVYWAGASSKGVVSIYSYNGATVEKVSSASIDTQLSVAGSSSITLTSAGWYGRHFVIIKASNTSYAYCVEEKTWGELSSSVPLWTYADGVASGTTIVCYLVSDVSTSGKVFVLNPATITYQDNGASFTATVQTSKWDDANNVYKFCSRTDVIGDRETSSSTLNINTYDDDYITASTTRSIDLSTANTSLYRCGRFRRRSWTLTHSDNTPMRLEALELTYTQGTR